MELKIPRYYISKSLDEVIKKLQISINNHLSNENYSKNQELKDVAPVDIYIDIYESFKFFNLFLSYDKKYIYLEDKDDDLVFVFNLSSELNFNQNLQLLLKLSNLINIIVSYLKIYDRKKYINELNIKYVMQIMDNASPFKNVYDSMYNKQIKLIKENYLNIEDNLEKQDVSEEKDIGNINKE